MARQLEMLIRQIRPEHSPALVQVHATHVDDAGMQVGIGIRVQNFGTDVYVAAAEARRIAAALVECADHYDAQKAALAAAQPAEA